MLEQNGKDSMYNGKIGRLVTVQKKDKLSPAVG